MSKTRAGAASQLLAILPAIAHVVMCDEIRDEIIEKFADLVGWTEPQVLATYGPVFDAAVWVSPVDEQVWHLAVVNDDTGDTMLVRTAEAVYLQAFDLLDKDQQRFVVSENTNHLRPGTNYAGFLFVTAHGLLTELER